MISCRVWSILKVIRQLRVTVKLHVPRRSSRSMKRRNPWWTALRIFKGNRARTKVGMSSYALQRLQACKIKANANAIKNR